VISDNLPQLSPSRVSGRNSYSPETHVKRGLRTVHGDVEVSEKCGCNDLIPLRARPRRLQGMLSEFLGLFDDAVMLFERRHASTSVMPL